MYKGIILLSLIVLISNNLIGQIEKLGIGLITPPLLIVDLDHAGFGFNDIGEYELELYDSPGMPSGKCLVQQKITNNQTLDYFVLEGDGQRRPIIKENGSFIWLRPKSYTLVYFQSNRYQNTYFKIKINNKTYWLNKNNLSHFGFTNKNWDPYLRYNKQALEVVYNMNLRSSPSANTKKLDLIKINGDQEERYHSIFFTGEFRGGKWAEVKIQFWKNRTACCSKTGEVQETIAWLKYIDNDGSPNLINQISCIPQ